jgi:hypothetical protein
MSGDNTENQNDEEFHSAESDTELIQNMDDNLD